MAPNLLPKICFDYAKQLEFKQKYTQSLKMYEKAQNHEIDENNKDIYAGIIRCTFQINIKFRK